MSPPAAVPPAATPPGPATRAPQLAETGSDGLLAASVASAGLLIGGAVLYRRSRAASRQW
ncbi:LPXTG cell wall anchor domain-containing protein [Streptomyces sp. ActVer]|uniref:LPXTG cell wall anchor domain-containing protein n=1 Tax=Streptomyces sp. ActVer TaxID=3014558 RepID=UPI0022B5AEFA|nr:LPXTG cell wall anchor domain-containing protein [Streptomyces sp. ActVer]MCZ4516805.1 LPXTG cell wall anchor domain-containing protein [Streptomyces sp. ActVer]